jgi:multicomponent Na+:H+ antiporter subunit E
MKIKSFVVMSLLLFGVWLLLNASLDSQVLMIGGGVSIFIALFLCANCSLFSEMKFNPKALFYSIIYIFVFLWALIKSNLDVAKRVVTPSLPINPGIVEVKTKLKSKIGRIVLANSITLTPGTLTIDIIDDSLFIHWIDVSSKDVEGATKAIVDDFEKYLEVIYG